MISSSSKSTRSPCNPNTCPFTDPMFSTYLSPMYDLYLPALKPEPSVHHICGNCALQGLRHCSGLRCPPVLPGPTKERVLYSSGAYARNLFTIGFCRQQNPWETLAAESSSGNKRRKVLKVIPSAELTLATGVVPDVLLEMDESDSDDLDRSCI